MSEENNEQPSSKKEKKKHDYRVQSPVNPEPKNESIFQFLVDIFSTGFPQKIIVAATYGPAGQRQGPIVREFPFRPNEDKPNSEALVELTNTILKVAQEDCDVLNKGRMRYSVQAFDPLRSDRSYSRKLFAVEPSGTSQMLAEQQGHLGFDDEENGVLPTKLMLSLLDQERRDKRWMMEMLGNVMAGAMDRDAARITKLEEIANGSFERSIKYIAATEQMLNQAEDRKAKQEWAKFKQKTVEEGVALLKSFAPAVQVYLSRGKHGIIEGLEQFIRSLGNEAEERLMGKWQEGKCVEKGILEEEQVQFIAGIVEGRIDPKRLPEMASTLRPDQMMAAQQVLRPEQLQSLGALIKAATDVASEAS